MESELRRTLQERFGFSAFLPGQLEVMSRLMAGTSAAAVFPTGGGKSICYQLPALLLPGLTVVISPLIALMNDQIQSLAARGVPAAKLDSTLSLEAHRDVMQRIRDRSLKLLYVAPERLQNERFREAMYRTPISLFAVDEAHCISEWGHNFRPDYLKLVDFAREARAECVLALTATATPRVLEDMCSAFQIAADNAIRTGFYRPNLTVLMTSVSAADRDRVLLERLQERPAGAAIVYVTLQRTSEEVAARLALHGLSSRAYHAGLDDGTRSEVQDWFLTSATGIVVATIAFGMGVDKPDIRYVYHYNLPKSLENFAQEIGRAGRDGQDSTCEMLVCLDDLNALENFALGDTPTEASVKALVNEVFAAGSEFDLAHYDLASRHDIRPLVVRTLITYLELDGYLVGGTPYFSSCKFKPLTSSAQILSHFEGERREFLQRLLAQSRKSQIWCYLDIDGAAQAIQAPRDRVVRALDYLAEQGWIELQTQGVKHRYSLRKAPANLAELARDLHGRTLLREERELGRLDQVVGLIQQDSCQVAALCRNFGEELGRPCGHCRWCLSGGKRLALPARQCPEFDRATEEALPKLCREYRDVLNEASVLTRFLCGLNSPRMTKAKLSGHALFGVWSHIPFRDVLSHVAGRFDGSTSGIVPLGDG